MDIIGSLEYMYFSAESFSRICKIDDWFLEDKYAVDAIHENGTETINEFQNNINNLDYRNPSDLKLGMECQLILDYAVLGL